MRLDGAHSHGHGGAGFGVLAAGAGLWLAAQAIASVIWVLFAGLALGCAVVVFLAVHHNRRESSNLVRRGAFPQVSALPHSHQHSVSAGQPHGERTLPPAVHVHYEFHLHPPAGAGAAPDGPARHTERIGGQPWPRLGGSSSSAGPGAEVKAIKQGHINAIRKGGFRRQADRAQRKLDRKYGR